MTSSSSPPSIPSPRLVVLLSGKRKCGKDFVAEKLRRHFSSQSLLEDGLRVGSEKAAAEDVQEEEATVADVRNAMIIRLSAPLKRRYALEHQLDFDQLLDSSEYKERYRKDMIVWGEERRRFDPGFFCRAAIDDALAECASTSSSLSKHSSRASQDDGEGLSGIRPSIWIVSDARRVSDLQFFRTHFPDSLRTIRVVASDATRQRRGWKFTAGVDDAESECGLDHVVDWDWVLINDDDHDDDDSLRPDIINGIFLPDLLNKLTFVP